MRRQMAWPQLLFALLFTISCSPPSPAVKVISVPDQGIAPDVEVGSDGVLHAVYVVGDDVYYATSSDGGVSFSQPLRVNSPPGTAFAGAFRGPDLALGQNGRVHVIWYTNGYQRKLPQDEWGVGYAFFDKEKKQFTPAVNLNHKPSDTYSMAADREGRIAVIWTADGAFIQLSEDNGHTFSAPEQIDQADPCECCATRAYFSPQGHLYLTYRDKTDNHRDMKLLVRRQGETVFTKQPLSQTTWPIEACPMTGSFLSDAGSHLLAAWEMKGAIYYGKTGYDGRLTEPGETRVSEVGRYPVVLPLPGEQTVVAWKEEKVFVWQTYDAKGKPAGQQTRQESSSSHRPTGITLSTGVALLFP